MRLGILFVYQGPNVCYKSFAESVGADSIYYNHLNLRYIKPFDPIFHFINGITLPKYDVYICEGALPVFTAAFKKLLFPNAKIIMIGGGYCHPLGIFKSKYVSLFMSLVDGYIAVSRMAMEKNKNYLKCPIEVVNTFINDERYEKLLKLKPDLESHVIVSIGTGVYKNIGLLVKAFELIKKQVDDAQLFILGKKNHLNELDGIEGITLSGFVSDISPYLEKASIYVQSSKADAFPVSTLEAMRAGLPAIVTNNVGTKNLVKELSPSYVVSKPEEIANKVIELWRLPQIDRKTLSVKARRLTDEFSRKSKSVEFRNKFTRIMQMVSKK